ncbi:MAG: ferredoxin [Halioglobus sp.]|nr:ferredoxin [Halioglobus sp.]
MPTSAPPAGDCVEICPKDLFSLLPVDERLWVKCRSREVGDEVLQECEVACTACGRCAVDAPPGVVAMKDGLPVVEAGGLRRHPADTVRPAIDRCPTGAIVWIGDDNVEIRGRQSKRVVRHAPLPPAV